MKILAIFIILVVVFTGCTMRFKGSLGYEYDGTIQKETVE